MEMIFIFFSGIIVGVFVYGAVDFAFARYIGLHFRSVTMTLFWVLSRLPPELRRQVKEAMK